jgi:hypothetical protein
MANWKLIGGITATVIIIGGIGSACGSDGSGSTGANSTGTSSTETSSTPTATSSAEKKTVPTFVGMGLQSAQDTAQGADFFNLASHDALGRGRNQILDRDWKVCSQNVKANTSASTDTKLDFGAVKLDETCPAKDQTEPSAASSTMPDFKGKSVKAARGALDSGTSITVNDASGNSRVVLMESNWQVCTQKPAAGAKLNGQPVELGAVKFEESCP